MPLVATSRHKTNVTVLTALCAAGALTGCSLTSVLSSRPQPIPREQIAGWSMPSGPPKATRVEIRQHPYPHPFVVNGVRHTHSTMVNVDIGTENALQILHKVSDACDLTLTMDPATEKALAASHIGKGSGMMTIGSSPDGIMRALLRQTSGPTGSLSCEMHGNRARIVPLTLDAAGFPKKVVTLNYPAGTLLDTVLADIFSGTGVSYGLAVSYLTPPPRIRTAVHVQQQPFRSALDNVLGATGSPPAFYYQPLGADPILIQPQDLHEVGPAVLSAAPVTCQFSNRPLRHALAALLPANQPPHWTLIDGGKDVRVSVSFNKAPMRLALPQLIRSCSSPMELHVYRNSLDPSGNDIRIIVRPPAHP